MSVYSKIKILVTGLQEELAATIGKLYGVIPNNTSPDQVVTRALDTATRVNNAGNIEDVFANKARIDFGLGNAKCPNLLVEKGVFNAAQNSGDVTNASYWPLGSDYAGSLPVTIMGETFVDLVGIAGSSMAVGAGRIGGGCIVTSLTNGQRYTISFYYKKTGGAKNSCGYYCLFNSLNIGGGFNIDDNTSFVIYNSAPVTNRVRKITQVATDLYLCEESFTASATANISHMFMGLTGYNVNSYIAGQRGAVGLPQIENNGVATSRIITTAVTVRTRNADLISKTGMSTTLANVKGVFADFYLQSSTITNDGSDRYVVAVAAVDNDNVNIYRLFDVLYGQIVDGAVTVANMAWTIISPQKNKRVKAFIHLETNNAKLYINGALVATDTACTIPSDLSRMNIGNWINPWDGLIKAVGVTDELTTTDIDQLAQYNTLEEMASEMQYTYEV